VRVIAGALRSRAIRAPRGDATRPTSDRVRESLFAVLGDVTDLVVLDLYAGSGALAFEAISRGASRAVCVEAARDAVKTIKENASSLGVTDRVTIVARKIAESAAAIEPAGPFDLVFADPPWPLVPNGELARDLSTLTKRPGLFSLDALLVLEHAARDEPPTLEGLAIDDRRRWGDTAVAFYRPAARAGA
jgi:16S rRNA (guanine966-N2)-methyltransferase